MEAGGASKRVRFSVEEPDPDDDEQDDRPRKLRFPKGKKGGGSENGTRSRQKDARIAATERALRRNVMDQHLRDTEDASNLNDISRAEEHYEDDDDNGKMEPFNLNAERRDGFFDDDGHYVEYETKFEARDAWLDSVEVDTRFADRHLSESSKVETEVELSTAEIGRIKKRIAEVLEPGETVLEALRRLRGGSSKGKREKLTGPAKITFDQLTEDAMKLMDSGESDVYEKPQEKFRREADAALKEEDLLDIFGDEEPSSSPAKPDAAAAPAPETGDESGYVFDSSSGYYYNASIGYFYDPTSGLYCSGESGKWFKFDEASNAYVEAT